MMFGKDSSPGMGSKLLAFQNILDAIEEISDDDLKPIIEKLKNEVHMQHEASEGDQMGVDDAAQGDENDLSSGMSQKPGLDVNIGMGGKPPMPGEEDEDEPKSGFLAVLSKKMKAKT